MTLTITRAAAAALSCTALALAGCGTGSSDDDGGGTPASGQAETLRTGPGVDAAGKSIRIGVLSTASGPAAALGTAYSQGIRTFFKAQNQRGGIDGYNVKLTIKDAQYQPQPHVEAYRGVVDDVAILASFGSPTTKAIQPLVDQEKIVTLPLSWDSAWAKDEVMAPVGTPYAIDTANTIDYVVNTKGEKDAKFGIIYQDDEYGADGLRGYEAALETYGFDDVARATYKVGDTDMTSQVQKMKNAGAEYVVVTALPGNAGGIVGTGASLGYKPRWLFQGPAFIEYQMTKDGTAKGKPTPLAKALDESVWVMQFASTWGDESKPGMAEFLADVKEFAPKQIPDPYFIYGYVQGKVMAAILSKAIAANDLSRQGVLTAKLSAGKIDVGGLVPPVEYSRKLEPNSYETQLAEVDADAPGFLRPLAEPFQGKAARAAAGL